MEATESEGGEVTGQIAGGEVNESHLPECPITVHEGNCCFDHPLFGFPCWCSALRACEQRVTGELLRAKTQPIGDKTWLAASYSIGFADALDAAREVVRALETGRAVSGDLTVYRSEALAAIDALRNPAISTPDDGNAGQS